MASVAQDSGRMATGTATGGAVRSNTLPQNSQAGRDVLPQNIIESTGTKVYGSEDTAVINYYLEVGASDTEAGALFDALSEAQERARAARDYAAFSWGGRNWLLRPRGVPLGGATGIYMAYVLEGGGLTVYLSGARYPSGFNFNGRISVGSECLMAADGIARHQATFREVWRSLGCRVLDERISRVDLAVEVPRAVADALQHWDKGGLITRFKDTSAHYKAGFRRTGIRCGKGDMVLRIYDKRQEIQDSMDDGKRAVMESRRAGWGEECTRVEWQLRGGALKGWDCLTVADWLRLRGAIMEYLMLKHSRLAEECRDRTHTTRARVSDFWLEAVEAFRKVCNGGRSAEPVQRVERSGARVVALAKQGLGCLLSALSLHSVQEGYEIKGSEVLEGLASLLEIGAGGADLVVEIDKRVRVLACKLPSRAVYWAEGC